MQFPSRVGVAIISDNASKSSLYSLMILPSLNGGFDVIVTFGMYSGFDIALFAEKVYEVKSRRLGRPTSDLYK